jgi:hypothetical protein
LGSPTISLILLDVHPGGILIMRRILGLSLAVLLLALALPALADDDVAVHKPVTDSSPYDVNIPDSLCVDADSLSEWNSGRGAPVWLEVDFGADTPLKLVRLLPSMRPEGNLSVTVYGRTSGGITYTLATWTGYARHRGPINITILDRTPVRYLNVLVTSTCSNVAWFSVQAINANGSTPVGLDTWGRLKALYR